jgi:hypothetical protein
MKKVIRLTEEDLTLIVKKVINETEKSKISPLGKLAKIGIVSSIVAAIIINFDRIEITDRNGNNVEVNIGDTYVCKVISVRQQSSGTGKSGVVIYYNITAEDNEGNIIKFIYDNPDFDKGDTIKVKVGRPMADYFVKGASKIDVLNRK